VALEVVARPGPATFVVASGFGTRAQWFRNVEANPRVRVWFRSRPPVAGTARVLTQEEGAAILTAYAEAHPRTWRKFKPVFEKTLGAPIDVHAPAMPLVALDTEPC
jgi:deazaflavin-dependent oxidoreductase (nitroreductase family)